MNPTNSDCLSHPMIEEMLRSAIGRVIGLDTDDNEYDSILPIWERELISSAHSTQPSSAAEESARQLEWYNKAYQYWESNENCPITDDGVLGGYGKLTPMDTRDSNAFLDKLLQNRAGLKLNRVADCGAGIGRVAKNLLLPRCGVVDLVEQSPRLLAAAPAYLCGYSATEAQAARAGQVQGAETVFSRINTAESSALMGRVNLVNVGLQDFSPAAGTYDLIWIQWVIGHLHDLDCVSFFRRCAAGLTAEGVIVLKDNVLLQRDLTFLWDRSDSSVARHQAYLKLLIRLAGLQVVQEALQRDFPEELFPVMMWAIVPAPRTIGAPSTTSSS